jgi:hypothetical protein
MCFPTIFFACLLLTTCGHAQSGVRLQHVEISAHDPIRILQLLLDNQHATPRVSNAGGGNWVSKLSGLVQNRSAQAVSGRASNGVSIRIVPVSASSVEPIFSSARPASSDVVAPAGPILWSAMTAAQIFGIGAQSAH